jgi:glycosyltransferase involved in cell wall biosynthesis
MFCPGTNPILPDYHDGVGGVQSVNHDIAEKLVALGYEVCVFGPPGSKTSADFVEIDVTRSEQDEFNVVEKYLSGYMEYVDILIDTSMFGIPGRMWEDIPYIYRCCNDSGKNICKNIDRNMIFPSISHLRFHTKGDCSCGNRRTSLKCKAPVIYEPVHYPGGIDSAPISKDGNKGKHVLYLGPIRKEEKVHALVKLAKKTKIRLRLVGPIKNHRYFSNRVEHNLSEDITYEPGIRDENRWKVLRDATAVIFISNENDGVLQVPAESLLVGMPVISLNKGTISEYITDGKSGFLCETIDDIFDKINKVNEIKVANCRQEVYDKFNIDTYIKKLVWLMEEVINGRRWI